jgi:competence protein ComEC
VREDVSIRNVAARDLSAGKDFAIAPDIAAKVLFPPAGFAGTMADDQALVVQLSLKNAKVLFVSDAGFATEQALLASRINLRSDVLVKGQHRSGNSGSDPFIDAVQPRLIIATSRDFPQQERISDEWAERIRSRGIKLFRQDETGAVELTFEPDRWQAKAFVAGETFRSTNR